MANTIPLDKRETITTTETGGLEKVPVLDRRFMTEINFIQYSIFPIHEPKDSPTLKEWHQEIKILLHDLEMLLALSHDKFWVQLVHDPTLHTALSTYLQKAPRAWDIWGIPERFIEAHNKLHKLIFLTLLRMSTDKESRECFLSPEAFGFAIYENYMFDIPKLIDICSLYGHPHGGNGTLVNKMLTNIFTKQESYIDDLKVVREQLLEQVFTNVTTKYDSAQTTIGLYDLLCYYFDTCMSLISFFYTYPPTLNYFNCTELISSFGTLYAHLFHNIKAKLKRLSTPASNLQSIKAIINRGQIATVRLIHCVIWHSCLVDELLDESGTEEEHTRCAEKFIAQLSTILGDTQIMTKYYHECNLPKTFAIIKNSKAEIAYEHFDYILNAVDIERDHEKDKQDLDKLHSSPSADLANGQYKDEDCPANIEALISNIKSIFPQYDSAFLKQCLNTYSYSSEEVITALLENNLPPHLEGAKKLAESNQPGPSRKDHVPPGPSRKDHVPPGPVLPVPKPSSSNSVQSSSNASANTTKSFVAARQNVYDHDEFDVFNNPDELNFDRIHIGKKNKEVRPHEGNAKEFLMKNQKLTFEYDEYDDEYDDTYDGLMMATGDETADQSSEFVIKPLNAPAEEEEREEGSEPQWRTADAAKRSKRGARPVTQPKPREVDKVGQKADAKVLNQRRRDNENKARRGNHNRRAGADRKRRGGMLHM